jgi:hypothetical protein
MPRVAPGSSSITNRDRADHSKSRSKTSSGFLIADLL